MRVINNIITPLNNVAAVAAASEKTGYNGLFSAEINNDPFLPIALAAEHTSSIELMTSIAVAFARNPMTLANTAHDLNEYSGGRFVLGIGSQIKPHITRRLSMPWSRPAARMREFILAMRAIWDCWHNDSPLRFEGEFYQHTLMTPMFTPAQRSAGPPKVKLAAVGPKMTAVAAEVADGMIAHGFTTATYMREVTLPTLERALAASGKNRRDFDVCCPFMAVSGLNEEAFNTNKQAVKMQLAFYASTPAYKPVLEKHGWGEVQERAHSLSKQGDWVAMADLITDEILAEFAVVCENPAQLSAALKSRFGDMVDSWQLTFDSGDPDFQQQLIRDLNAG